MRADIGSVSSQRPAVVTRLSALAVLSRDETNLLETISAVTERHQPGAEFFIEGQMLSRPRVLITGWACRARILPDGRRQIFGFYLPGDLIGLCLRRQMMALSSGLALTPLALANAAAVRQALLQHPERNPGLLAACLCADGLEEAYLLNQIARVGRQTAYERLAHLLLEFRSRLVLAGLAKGGRFEMPLTQEVLADALGLSIVHVNRTLQQLRREHLVELRPPFVTLHDPDLLASIADYKEASVFYE
jgi:CRP-like cAMP-binding protein